MVDITRLYHPAYSNALRAGATLLARIDGRIERIVAKPLPLSAMPDGNDIALHYHQVGQERLRAMKRWFEQAEDAAAQLAVQGVTAALFDRARSGIGDHVKTSLLQGALATVMRQAFGKVATAPPKHDLTYRGIKLCFLTVECRDGTYIQMCARQDRHFKNWLTALGLEEVGADPRYANGPLKIQKVEDIEELEGLIRAEDAHSRASRVDADLHRRLRHRCGPFPSSRAVSGAPSAQGERFRDRLCASAHRTHRDARASGQVARVFRQRWQGGTGPGGAHARAMERTRENGSFRADASTRICSGAIVEATARRHHDSGDRLLRRGASRCRLSSRSSGPG